MLYLSSYDCLVPGLYLAGTFISHSSRSYVWDGVERIVHFDLISLGSSVCEIRYPTVLPEGMVYGGGHSLGDDVFYFVRPGSGKGGIFYTLLDDKTDIPVP